MKQDYFSREALRADLSIFEARIIELDQQLVYAAGQAPNRQQGRISHRAMARMQRRERSQIASRQALLRSWLAKA